MAIWKPQSLVDSLKMANETNNELLKSNKKLLDADKILADDIKKMDETIKSNTNWYLTQINTLGMYLKEKHNDNYVFDQLKGLNGIEPIKKKNYDVDELLDKIKVGGWDSLTLDEIKYLKDQGENK
jgi:hypothetical protein